MLTLMKTVSVAAVSLAALVAAGCASGNGGSDGGSSASGGMMCPKCETVWVSETVGQGTKVQRLAYDRKMTCPDCDAMAKSQLMGDGKVMLHECATCKVTPKALSPSPKLTHPKGTHG